VRGNASISASSLGFSGTSSLCVGRDLDLAGKFAHEFVLLGVGLEATMSVLGRRVDELDLELLGLPRLGAWEQSLADNDRSLAGSHDATLDQEEVIVDFTVVRETTHWGNVLVNGIGLAHGVVADAVLGTDTHSVDLLMEVGSRVVTLLTTAGNSPLDGGRMPRSDTSDFTETSVSLTVKTRATESLDGADHTLTAGNANSINDLVHVEDLADFDFLLELAIGEVDLIGEGATVDLDLHDVSLVLAEVELANLGGGENAHDRAVLLDAVEVTVDRALLLLTKLVLVGVL